MAKSPWTGSPAGVPLPAGLNPLEGGVKGGSISGSLSGEVSSVIKTTSGTLSISGISGHAFLFCNCPGKFGSLKISTEGKWEYTVDAENSSVKALIGGGVLLDRYPVIACGVNAIAVSVIEITIKSSGAFGYASLVIEDAPVLYWRFSETSGLVVADSSGNNYSGTYRQDAAGITTAGLLGDGDSAVLVRPPVGTAGAWRSALPIYTGVTAEWTAEIVIKLDNNPPSGQTVWQLGADGGRCPAIAVAPSSAGKYRVYVAESGFSNIITSNNEFLWGEKALIHVVQRSGGRDLYVNGAIEGTRSGTYGEFRAGVMRVGYAKFSSEEYPCNGTIDEFALYSKALTAARIAQRFAAL